MAYFITAEHARAISESKNWLFDIIFQRITEAANVGDRMIRVGYDSTGDDYGPEMRAFYNGNYQDSVNSSMTRNVFREKLESLGFTFKWQQSGIEISW